MKAIIGKAAYDYDIELVELEVLGEHIHMVAIAGSRITQPDVMQIIKSISAKECSRMYPEIKMKFFGSGKLWAQSYFVGTIGNTNEGGDSLICSGSA